MTTKRPFHEPRLIEETSLATLTLMSATSGLVACETTACV
jgi:hypothetical protein